MLRAMEALSARTIPTAPGQVTGTGRGSTGHKAPPKGILKKTSGGSCTVSEAGSVETTLLLGTGHTEKDAGALVSAMSTVTAWIQVPARLADAWTLGKSYGKRMASTLGFGFGTREVPRGMSKTRRPRDETAPSGGAISWRGEWPQDEGEDAEDGG